MMIQAGEPVVVFIESNTTGTGRLLIQEAVSRGYGVVFCCMNPARYDFVKEFPIALKIVDTNDINAIQAALIVYSSIVGVISTTDATLQVTAMLAERLGLVGNDPRAIEICQSKPLQQRTLQAAGIKVPRSLEVVGPNCNNTVTLHELQMHFPMVGKPARGTGSIGVRLINTEAELNNYLEGFGQSQTLLQEYIEGQEYSVETLTISGKTQVIGITQKLLSKPPMFVEIGHNFPARLEDALSQVIRDTVVQALAAVGFTNGPAHTELRVANGEAVIIEINPRLAGGMIPILVSQSLGFDLLSYLLDFYLGLSLVSIPDDRKPVRFSAIRHLCVDHRTTVAELGLCASETLPQDVIAWYVKPASSVVGGYGDFRDRCAYVIACGDSLESASDLAEEILTRTTSRSVQKGELEQRLQRRLQNTGRLQSALDPAAQRLLSTTNLDRSIEAELSLYADIDEAHLLMLLQVQVLQKGTVYTLLSTLSRWRREQFSIFRGLPCPRGLYLTYEGVLAETLGEQIGGVLQTARSRNDHRATLEKLKLRHRFNVVMVASHALARSLLHCANQNVQTPLPVFSQYQVAMPGTLGHYCLAVVSNVLRSMRSLQNQVAQINVLPLGACAGGGTSIPIQPEITARLLGFEEGCENSLDAVSEGDGHLRFLAELDILATLFSRVAQDLQVFSTSGLKLISFPDSLSGSSSAMPQKKNPYLLEHVKAMSDGLGSELNRYRAALHKTPLGNSYEANVVAIQVWETSTSAIEACAKLLAMLVTSMQVDQEACVSLLRQEHATATFAAEQLVQTKGMEFRAAHHKVGQFIRDGASPQNSTDVTEMVNWLEDTTTALSKLTLGGGPAPDITMTTSQRLSHQLDVLMCGYRQAIRSWTGAAARRKLLVAAFLSTGCVDGLNALAIDDGVLSNWTKHD